jgi:hypothetical protein
MELLFVQLDVSQRKNSYENIIQPLLPGGYFLSLWGSPDNRGPNEPMLCLGGHSALFIECTQQRHLKFSSKLWTLKGGSDVPPYCWIMHRKAKCYQTPGWCTSNQPEGAIQKFIGRAYDFFLSFLFFLWCWDGTQGLALISTALFSLAAPLAQETVTFLPWRRGTPTLAHTVASVLGGQ